jgi:hypothetical protein
LSIMYSLGRLSALLLSLSGKYDFKDLSLQIALESYEEGNSLCLEEKYRTACNAYMNGILVGRKSVQRLVENYSSDGDKEDDPEAALDWLVSSYLKCAKARMEMKDWQTARADAWAACSYTQNTNLEALTCMLSICEATNDQLGQIQTLKSILPLVSAAPSSELAGFSKLDLEQKIGVLDDELMRKMRGE